MSGSRSWMPCTTLAGALVCCVGCATPAGDTSPRLIDDFASPAAWSAHPADGVELAIGTAPGFAGTALALEFRFVGGGYAIARREVDLELPENFAFRFRLRGEAPANTLEFKLVDPSGENVWWHVQRDVVWPDRWREVTIRKRQITFAWGPQGEGEPRHVAAIEFAVTAGAGGAGTIWIDELELVPLPVSSGPPPALRASSSTAAANHDAALAIDGDPGTAWMPAPGDAMPVLDVDLGTEREFGGLTLDWNPDRRPAAYDVETSADGVHWELLQRVRGAAGARDYLYLPETAAHHVRLRVWRPADTVTVPFLREITVQPLAFGASRENFFAAVAGEARRGLYPRGLRGEQVYWTVVGADGESAEGLLDTDGALEAGAGQFRLEPFLRAGGRLLTWADVSSAHALAEGCLPVPTVTWSCDGWVLRITVFAVGTPGRPGLVARYRLTNTAPRARTATLCLALRPFQVNPPSQFLNLRGGVASVGTIARRGEVVVVDGAERIRVLGPEPDHFGAAAFAAGDPVRDVLENGDLAGLRGGPVDDPFAAASAVMLWDLDVPAGGQAERSVSVALPGGTPPLAADVEAVVWCDRAQRAAEDRWRAALGGATVTGPQAAADVLLTLRAQLAYILINRDGPAIQPGSRAYARSWIRDGSLTGQALLRLGRADVARDFLAWYAPHQYASGKIPCVVDARGADPVPEHDSTGEFIFLVAETYRYTGDLDLVRRHWPRVVAGMGYLESLLEQERASTAGAGDRGAFFGILPPSISHEGYAAKPMHSYWDNFFAARGYKDAVWLGEQLVQAGADTLISEVAWLVAARDRFLSDLGASVAAAMEHHGIDYVPGCADLGDFDPTSTTIALAPAEVTAILPPGAVTRTFARYWEFFSARRDGEPWEALTPYELRNVGACVRLGWRERANAVLDWFLTCRRPPGWRQWAEVVRRDAGTAHFIGDMPHTWVGSDYVRSVLDMLAFATGTDTPDSAALVLAAGVPAAWLDAPGLAVADLPTPFGPLDYALVRRGDAVVLSVDSGPRVPPGGIRLRPPAVGGSAVVDGRPVAVGPGGEVRLRKLPATVVWPAAARHPSR